ncbi:MAG: hypothetical protein JST43_14630 [Bacteroidetes bacterium]|nr:hypothetical protein [Bacteroidota bacterium]MBS1540381.1 hypothetical protein [Bacteroidota bacterium]
MLEDKGLIRLSREVATNKADEGKRIYVITSAGMAMLKAMKESRMELWKLVPQLKVS